MTMSDVAKQAGVSTMTVSNVVNGRPKVSARTRERVLEVMAELGYQMNLTARNLRAGRTNSIALVVPNFSGFFGELADQMGEMLAAAANEATAPVAILIPLRGVSMLDSEGGRFWDPEADKACYDAIKQNLRADIPVYEIDHNINDPEFSAAVAQKMLELLAQQKAPA